MGWGRDENNKLQVFISNCCFCCIFYVIDQRFPNVGRDPKVGRERFSFGSPSSNEMSTNKNRNIQKIVIFKIWVAVKFRNPNWVVIKKVWETLLNIDYII